MRYRFSYMLYDVGVSDVPYQFIMEHNAYLTWGQ